MAVYRDMVRCTTGCIGRCTFCRVPVLELRNDTVECICDARNRDNEITIPATWGIAVITAISCFFRSNYTVDPKVEPSIDCWSAPIRPLGILDSLSSRSLYYRGLIKLSGKERRMKIILNEDVYNLGEEGDVCDVARGYARNYLFPKQLAFPHTKENIANFESRKASIEKRKEDKRQQALSLKERLDGKEVVITMNAGQGGKLFGSVTSAMIVEELQKEGIEVEKKKIDFKSQSVKMVGTYPVTVKLYENNEAELKLKVVSQSGMEQPPQKKTEEKKAEKQAEEPEAEVAAKEKSSPEDSTDGSAAGEVPAETAAEEKSAEKAAAEAVVAAEEAEPEEEKEE